MRFYQFLIDWGIAARYRRRYIGEWVNIYKKRKLIRTVKLTGEQKKEIDCLWKENYGKKIPYYWHRLYTSYTGKFDANYFPEIFYSTRLERKTDDWNVAIAYEDKAQLDLVLGGHTALSYISKTAGRFYNADHAPISEDEAIAVVGNVGRCVVKPTVDSGSGIGVHILDLENGVNIRTGQKVSDLLADCGDNFLIQEYINVHDTMKNIYPGSVNTLRIVTYLTDSGVTHAPLAMRMGAGGAEIDNIHRGGLSVGVNDDGSLTPVAFSEYGNKFTVHPDTGIVFDGYKIASVPEAIDLVEKLHTRIPRLTFISWDVTILASGEPVIIEINTRSQSIWFPQMVNGRSFFGKNTAKMIREIKGNL